jgi:hypothetical protein
MWRLYTRDWRARTPWGVARNDPGTVQYLVDPDLGVALMLTAVGQQQRGDS